MTQAEDHLTDTAVAAREADTASPDGGPRSRRSLITGAAAALGALAAQAVVLPSPASAAGVVLGGANNTTTPTIIQDTAAGAGAKALVGRTTSAASTTSIGVQGESLGGSGIGVYGTANNGTSARGVLGRSTNGYGVRGESTTGSGVYGRSTTGYGVYGQSTGFSGLRGYGAIGVYAESTGSGNGGEFYGGPTGVYGFGTDSGVYGSGVNYGVYAYSSAGYAGWFAGKVAVTGTLTKPAGSFKIDHPLDPERRWLSHSFVESPDMMNLYNGNVTTGARSLATVTLPRYFHALNRDFRYQLTVVGTMAQAVIDREIEGGRFRIRTSEPNVKVSWQVTGIRQDDYANAHRIRVDVPKTTKERGTRLFVPKGSGARRMDLGPVEPKHHKLAKPKATRPG